MSKIKLLSVFGTRPEASKMCPILLKFREYPEIESKLCVTAQHRSMLDQMLLTFGVKADHDLNIMKERQTLSDITIGALRGLQEVLREEKPDMVLVHGDTTTTFAAALAAFYGGVKAAHVEAGLRSFDKTQPYPEEMNRLMTDRLADLYLAPTKNARLNLLNEGIAGDCIYVTGNTAIDAVMFSVRGGDYRFEQEELNRVDFSKRVITMTAHRKENLGKPHEDIFKAMRRIVDENPDVFLVYPVHLNPVVRQCANSILAGHDRILLTEPTGILDMHNLIGRSYIIVSDSGGLQEEAPALNKPVIVLRNVTERPEGLEAGTLRLAGNTEQGVFDCVSAVLNDKAVYKAMAESRNPFGDGKASARIAEAILHYFGLRADKPADFE